MARFRVIAWECQKHSVEVEAETEEEAMRIAEQGDGFYDFEPDYTGEDYLFEIERAERKDCA